MKEFMKKHPALEDTCDTVLSLLSGSFALLAVGFVWVKELIGRKVLEFFRNTPSSGVKR